MLPRSYELGILQDRVQLLLLDSADVNKGNVSLHGQPGFPGQRRLRMCRPGAVQQLPKASSTPRAAPVDIPSGGDARMHEQQVGDSHLASGIAVQ